MYLSLKAHEELPVGQDTDRLNYARQIIHGEAIALEDMARRLDDSFLQGVDLFHHCQGRIAITGTGKSADVGQKIAGTLNSTGTRAYVLDATRAVHGDLGMVHPDDIALVLSFSGESEEIVRLLPPLRSRIAGLVAMTGRARCTLARNADVALILGDLEEMCPLGLAPSTSTTVMLALGDALAFSLSRLRGFDHEDFARNHPAGSLGRKLIKVEGIMRRGDDLRLASTDQTVREVFSRLPSRGRRTGAVIITDKEGLLAGIFTDSDLARLFEKRRDDALDRPIHEVMTHKPITTKVGNRVAEAVEILRQRKISELPVVDHQGKPVGMIDITDLIGFLPSEEVQAVARVA